MIDLTPGQREVLHALSNCVPWITIAEVTRSRGVGSVQGNAVLLRDLVTFGLVDRRQMLVERPTEHRMVWRLAPCFRLSEAGFVERFGPEET